MRFIKTGDALSKTDHISKNSVLSLKKKLFKEFFLLYTQKDLHNRLPEGRQFTDLLPETLKDGLYTTLDKKTDWEM